MRDRLNFVTNAMNRDFWTCGGSFVDFVANTILCDPRCIDLVAGATFYKPRNADFVPDTTLYEPQNSIFVAANFVVGAIFI